MKTVSLQNQYLRALRRLLLTLLPVITALWAMPRSASAQLYVIYNGSENAGVGEYNANTGEPINANTGLNGPVELALSAGDLHMANYGIADDGTVGVYNATNGDVINTDLISGIYAPNRLAIASVAEPSPWSMIAVGGVGLLGFLVRKSRKHRQRGGLNAGRVAPRDQVETKF